MYLYNVQSLQKNAYNLDLELQRHKKHNITSKHIESSNYNCKEHAIYKITTY